jgi:flagellar biosynthesis/type III secretory pathway M-ring protein FliF/YscJ
MDNSTTVWIIVAIVALLLVALLVWFLARRSRTAKDKRRVAQREEAGELRRRAEHDRIGVQEGEASAAKLDAEARLAQAEADRKAAEAARLQEAAHEHSAKVGESRAELDERLRRADELDPGPERTPEQRADTAPDTHGDEQTDRDGRHRA